MTEKKSGGGLGFRDLNCFNLAMLAKFGWRLLMDNHSLVSRVLKANYYPESLFLEAKDGLNSSWAWLSILEGRKVIQRGIRWKVGNSRSIRVAYILGFRDRQRLTQDGWPWRGGICWYVISLKKHPKMAS